MLKVGVLCSGGLGYECLKQLFSQVDLVFVMTDTKSEPIIEFCGLKKVPCYKGNPRGGRGFEFIKDKEVDVIASINYLFLIETDLIEFPKKLAFNIHGSLLPKYRGRTPHVWSIINGEKEAGITAHLIAEGCDTGDIIEQIRIPITSDDTGADLLRKYEKEYGPFIFRILEKIKSNSLNLLKQDNTKATNFPKRSPEDGEISWSWYKERIRNWIRAQAHPYPGAFTYYEGEKIIIDKVSFSDFGFDSQLDNGTILTTSPKIVVKCCNGALCLDSIRSKSSNFQSGNKFHHEDRK